MTDQHPRHTVKCGKHSILAFNPLNGYTQKYPHDGQYSRDKIISHLLHAPNPKKRSELRIAPKPSITSGKLDQPCLYVHSSVLSSAVVILKVSLSSSFFLFAKLIANVIARFLASSLGLAGREQCRELARSPGPAARRVYPIDKMLPNNM